MAKSQTAIIKATNKKVKVYKHKLSDKWVNANDCTTMYNPNELTINPV